jgi:CubicO group peptidase (beta-lactamase class C family)
MTRRRALLALLVAAAALAGCSGERAVTPAPMLIHLSPGGGGDFTDLGVAVARAPAGATIFLAAGTYTLDQPLDVFRSLTLEGAGARRTFVTGALRRRLLGFSGNGTFAASGITFRRQGDTQGDAVQVLGGHVQFRLCRFEGPGVGRGARGRGAGLRLMGATTGSLDRCSASGNKGHGVVIEDPAAPRLLNVDTSGNGRPGVGRVTRAGPTDRGELEVFVEKIVTDAMRARHIPGAVFVLVRDGRPFLARGWGYADLARGTLMDPATSRLRVASLSKVVTATAVMQLFSRGRLLLSDDVDSFLRGFQLPRTYPAPVTVGDLLTQSGGLDDAVSGSAARAPRAAEPLTAYLAGNLPRRIAAPGAIYSYSNKGLALAGEVVQRASGLPYADYVARNIFAPLGMDASGFTPPLRPGPDWALGYRRDGDRAVPVGFDYLDNVPGIGMVSTGADMGRFMLALLGLGALGQARILDPVTASIMQAEQFTDFPGLPGSTYGFQEVFQNGRAALRHNGDWGGFSSAMVLMPRERLGFFIADNGGDGELRNDLIAQFIDRYYPQRVQLGSPPTPPDFADTARRFVGSYRGTRYSHGTFEKLFAFSASAEVDVSNDAMALSLDGTRYVQIEPLLFRSDSSDDQIAFQAAPDGSIAYLFNGVGAYEHVAWYATYRWTRRLLIAVVLVLLLTLAVWPGAELWRRAHGRRGRGPRLAGAARRLAALTAALDLAFLAGLALAFARVDFVYGVPPTVVALLVLPNVGAILGVALVPLAVLAWRRRWWDRLGRLQYSLTTLAALGFIWFCLVWNLLGMRV